MSMRRIIASALLFGLAWPLAAQDEVTPITTSRPQPTGDRMLVFDSLPDVFPSGSTKLVNGTLIIDLAAWSAIVVAKRGPREYCTATLIGPRVLLTAAHCIDAGFGDKAAVTPGRVNIRGSQYTLIGCEMHYDYVKADRRGVDLPRNSEDYALCELNGVPPVIFETIVEGPTVGRGSQVLMSGYGCTGIRVVANQLAYDWSDQEGSERLRMGDAAFDAVDVADHTNAAGRYLRVKSTRGEPVLCPGDSGGPAISGASLAQQKGPLRRIIGVNSMVSAVPASGKYHYLSFISSLGAPSFDTFLKKWQSKGDPASNRLVCGRGLRPGEQNCRA